MKHPKLRREPRDVCAQLDDDDGLEARRAERSARRGGRRAGIADRRLCKVARHAIDHVLFSLATDPMLSRLHTHSVEFERGRLLVVLSPDAALSEEEHAVAGVLAERLRPALRAAVAAAVVRKHVPELTIEVSTHPLETGVEDE
jgi:hypothetical protein